MPKKSKKQQLRTQGHGFVEVTPDIVLVTLGVVLRDKSLEKVQAEATQAMTEVRTVLTDAGIPDSDIRTGRYGIDREVDYKTRKFLGYSLTHLLNVKIRDWGLAGSIIDDVVAAGANDVGHLQPMVDDRRRYEREASKLAVADALEQAQIMAEAAGCQLGRILLISDVNEPLPEPRVFATRMMKVSPDDGSSTMIEAGSEQIEAQVTLVMQLLK